MRIRVMKQKQKSANGKKRITRYIVKVGSWVVGLHRTKSAANKNAASWRKMQW